MTLLTTWPTVTDGDRYTGTVWNNALNAAQKAAIEALIHSVLNSTISPAQAIDELVNARGSMIDLGIRLSVSLNDDGTLKTQASLAALADVASSIGHGNWVHNDDFFIWAGGDAVAPTGWTLAGAGATIARETGAANVKVGSMSVKLTRVGANCGIYQRVINATSFAAAGLHLKGQSFGFGCWMKTNTAFRGLLSMSDGVATTYSPYHSGSGNWEWLSGVFTVSGSATNVYIQASCNTADAEVYISGVTVIPGNIAPAAHVPCPKLYGTLAFKHIGVLTAADNDKDRFRFARPTLVKEVVLEVKTAPATNPIVVDINHFRGGWTSMFSTKPQIAAGAGSGSAIPDAAYEYRCFAGANGTTRTDATLGWDVDSVGAAPAGSDLWVMVRCLQYARPQESFLDVADGF